MLTKRATGLYRYILELVGLKTCQMEREKKMKTIINFKVFKVAQLF